MIRSEFVPSGSDRPVVSHKWWGESKEPGSDREILADNQKTDPHDGATM